jgi:hypothetical protein
VGMALYRATTFWLLKNSCFVSGHDCGILGDCPYALYQGTT